MRFYKKIISASLLLALLLTGSTNVFASETNLETNDETQAYVLNSFTGEQLASVSDFQINEHRVTFQHDGINYDFGISGLSIDTSDGMNVDGANYYYGNIGDMVCSVVEYDENYCIQVFDSSKSIFDRKNNSKNNFTIVNGKISNNELSTFSVELAKKNVEIEKMQNNSTRGDLHVYISGTTIPFLLSGGSAEGWCNATLRENSNYQVSSLRYSIAYNWPSDGVSLWYDYMNSNQAYHSPAWPSSKLTNVTGSWIINSYSGAFMAEATISALVKGAPLMWSLYDVSYMNGTHQ